GRAGPRRGPRRGGGVACAARRRAAAPALEQADPEGMAAGRARAAAPTWELPVGSVGQVGRGEGCCEDVCRTRHGGRAGEPPDPRGGRHVSFPHVVMLVANDVVTDTRVKKEALALAGAGARVTVVGAASDRAPDRSAVGPVT